MNHLSAEFGCNVFNDNVMRERLPKETYKRLQNTMRDGHHLDSEVATIVANAMKDWAIEKGATHYTHWFMPLNGVTAEKHDGFLSPTSDGRVIAEFSGKELIQGEPDASSFPSGGLRATFEARGYTAWDPNSYAFIKEGVLCIPTAFCSFGAEALDKKTPLLRSSEALNRQAMRVLRLFGNEGVSSVKTTVGAEQEYFLIDAAMYEKRKDLIYTGRTLFGARPPKGQEMDDHYFGAIQPRVKAFMNELNHELWKLGVLAKTEHNEVAPAQHELAPVFTVVNLATDHNQLTMELMQRIAKKHNMICLLHEKPFAGVNGSGKHNNWSMCTNTGVNLLEPGETPYENAQFLLLLCAVIEAVDDYQDLLRISVASAGNDHRLGASEAPPAIVSMYLGSELVDILHAIEIDADYGNHEKEVLKVGVHTLPRFPKDSADRNRTSPFAFTGNKFEFRMPGSAASIADCNIVINTAVAESLRKFADRLEGADDFEKELHDVIRETIIDHKRILFNGNGYEDAWRVEAEARGLLNLKSTPDCVPYILAAKNVELFARHKVFSRTELESRHEVMLEYYAKALNIEALTMVDMARRDILPAVSDYTRELAQSVALKNQIGASAVYESETAHRLSELMTNAFAKTQALENALINAGSRSTLDQARYYHDCVFAAMNELRVVVDEMETQTDAKHWPYPTYGDILFSVKN